MGFFSWMKEKVKSAASWVKEKVKSAASWVGDKVKSAASAVKTGVTNVWNKFTGKETFDKAKKLYDEIEAKYNRRKQKFESDVNDYVDRIEKRVASINRSKEKIKRELFPQMAEQLKKIKDIQVSEDFTTEKYLHEVLKLDSLREKDQLFKIDFDKHKFKTSMQAIFTLGFFTRKKAKESLYAVEEEEGKINTEIAKMDAETAKLKAIEMSLENVEGYFTSLIELYENMLVRLDNSVNFLYVRCLSFVHKLVQKEMSIRKLPVMQQKEIEAIITASHILKKMTDAQLLSLGNPETVESYAKEMKQQRDQVRQAYDAA